MILKEISDRFLALLLLLFLAPVMITVAILIFLFMGRPVLFKQLRPGKNEKIFKIFKFRTMAIALNQQGELLPDGLRMTPLGVWLRKLSLDELPQLWNVLIGDMSFVGPRPLLPEYLNRYSDEQKKRHQMKPGITGLAQVTGRNSHTWEERLKQDVLYIENWSIWLDIKIFFLTFYKVFRVSETSAEGSATMPPFLGNNTEK